MLDLVIVKVIWLIFAFGLVYMHMAYVHRPPLPWTRPVILGQLSCDLVGFVTTYAMLSHHRPGETWVFVFLAVHFVVHVLSLGWALFGWPSLRDHMRDFQARTLPPSFSASEFLYEQSDTALYLVTMAIVASTLPIGLLVPLCMTVSALVAVLRPTAGLGRPPRRAVAGEGT